MKPADLPDPESYPHGTRARYVGAKCRCDACRAANTQYARERAEQAKQRALEDATGDDAASAPKLWTAPDGSKRTRVYRRACKGINGQPCPHGAHLRKDSTGDICGRCRVALAYRGLVPSKRARAHLIALAAKGIGIKAVRDACDVSSTILWDVRNGLQPHIRVETERRILAVDRHAAADHAIIDGRRTHRAIARMQALGLTKTEIAQRLGRATHAIQIKPSVIAKTEARVLRLFAEVKRETLASKLAPKICPICGLSHDKADRLRVIARMLPASFAEVTAAWPCLYENTNTGYVRFMRDRRAVQDQEKSQP